MAKLTSAEIERQNKITANHLLLQSLGLEGGADAVLMAKPKPKPAPVLEPKKTKAPKKRRNSSSLDSEEQSDIPRKAARTDGSVDPETTNSIRRSGRLAGKKVDYVNIERDPSVHTLKSQGLSDGVMDRAPRSLTKRTHDPKQYGHIPGVEVGSWWLTREECSIDAIHAPWVGGISCGPKGAYSIALSGGYDDDVDLGVAFTYTGSGGRDLKGTKEKPKNLRTAPQSSDQTFDNNFNKALQLSSQTGKPVRVIRGFKLRSPFAPWEGYRYDGLYKVEKAWQEVGLNTKYLVCKFALKRLPGQPPLQKRDPDAKMDDESDDASGEDDSEDDNTQSSEGSSTRIGTDEAEKEK